MGFTLTQASEGLKLKPYIDPVGIPTVCYGHTGPDVKLGVPWTKAECDRVFYKDVNVAVAGLNQCVKRSLNANQAAALVDFTFNVGVPKACSSTLVKMVNSGDYDGAGRQFNKWVYAKVNGKMKPLGGLVKRRQADTDLWFTPVTGSTQSINTEALKALIKDTK